MGLDQGSLLKNSLAYNPVTSLGYWGAKGLGAFGSGGNGSTSQVPLEDPAQSAVRSILAEFARSGKLPNGFEAGAQVPLGYGDYSMTPAEQTGQSSLMELLKSVPQQFQMGDSALNDFLNPSQKQVQDQYAPFKSQVNRQIASSDAALKRSAGAMGSLYSTSTIKGLGDVQARGNESLISNLANLNNEQLNRKLQAIPLAYQSAEAQQGSALQRIGASQQYGDLARSLNDQAIKARDAELLRRRSEMQLPLQAAEGLADSGVQFGVPSVPNPSPYAQLLQMVGQVGGTALGTYLGGPAGGAVGGKLGSSLTAPQPSPFTSSDVGPWSGGYTFPQSNGPSGVYGNTAKLSH